MDCYLCGATNAPDVDYCVHCDGQLLRIGASDIPETEPVDPMAPPPIPIDDSAAADAIAPPPIPAPPIPSSAGTSDAEIFDVLDDDIFGHTQNEPDNLQERDLGSLDNLSPNGEWPQASDEDSFPESIDDADPIADVLGGLDDEDTGPFLGDDSEEPNETTRKGRPSMPRIGSLKKLEHQRLQEALGLENESSEIDIGEINVTAVPTAHMSAEIPVIGTAQPATTSSAPAESGGGGKAVLVVFSILIGLAVWLGLKAFSTSVTPPDELAFRNPTTTVVASSTTSVPRPWAVSEVEGEFAASFVTVVLHDCTVADAESGSFFASEPAATDATSGIAINANNVVIGADVLPQADVATVRTRVGSTIYALIHEHPDGVRVVNFPTRISKHLLLESGAETSPAWFLHKNIETNEITTSDVSNPSEMELLGSAYGEPVGIKSGGTVLDVEMLATVDHRASLPSGDELKHAKTSCDFRNFLIDETPGAPATLDIEDPTNAEDTAIVDDSGDSQ